MRKDLKRLLETAKYRDLYRVSLSITLVNCVKTDEHIIHIFNHLTAPSFQ